ncbi:MAG: hypothetical protein CVU02_00285 [Bacteroidetes bacterium HGW-Bacteroidetes-19]|nr:MAG: hypothetical protein CVU02_00285 [Bacteroidetes bacterium HGW-Bacteroidetes-19]
MKCNYHTHTTYCDGKEEMKTFVQKAIELQFDHLGFSSHAPILKENDFSIQKEEIPLYIADIEKYQLEFPNITLFKALECDFIPELTYPFDYFKDTFNLDYIIGGVHLVKVLGQDKIWFIDGSKQQIYDDGLSILFQNNIKKAVTAFWEQTFEMIETQKFDIIAHLDKIKMHNQNRFFNEKEKWYIDLVDHAISLLYKHNVIVEINSRGIYKRRCSDFYPSDYILKEIAKKGIAVVISSDAHKSDELDLFYEEAKTKLKSFGIGELVYKTVNGWKNDLF